MKLKPTFSGTPSVFAHLIVASSSTGPDRVVATPTLAHLDNATDM